jgi:paraquat-inducible protein B
MGSTEGGHSGAAGHSHQRQPNHDEFPRAERASGHQERPAARQPQRHLGEGRRRNEQARQTLQSVAQFVEPESPLSTQLTGSLQEVSEAARALRLLANLLERNPSVLVRGKDVTPQ